MIWVLVDLSYLAYRAMHSMGDLSHEDLPTGVIFGLFSQLKQICLDPRINSNKVAFFADSRTSLRKAEYPTYKMGREKDRSPEDWAKIRVMHRQIDDLRRKILPAIGFPVFSQKGLEGDDVMAMAAQCLSAFARQREGVMVTADGDLYQAITPTVHWWDPSRNVYHDPDTFEQKKGILPNMWGEVKCLAGCSTDNVAGIPGVGEATAVRFLLGNLSAKYKRHEAIVSKKGLRIRQRNRRLVCLPHPSTELVHMLDPSYDSAAFFGVCEVYGLASFLAERRSWERFFRGTFPQPRARGTKRVMKGFGL